MNGGVSLSPNRHKIKHEENNQANLKGKQKRQKDDNTYLERGLDVHHLLVREVHEHLCAQIVHLHLVRGPRDHASGVETHLSAHAHRRLESHGVREISSHVFGNLEKTDEMSLVRTRCLFDML